MRFGDYERYARDMEAGKIVHPPLPDDPMRGPFSRLGQNISVGRSRYHLVVGPPGSGKTSFTDTNFVLKPYLYWYYHGGPKPYFIYRSMERNSMFKEVKWKSALMYYLDNYVLDVPTILGLSNKKRDLTAKDKEMLKKYDKFLADMQSNSLDIKDGSAAPDDILNYAVKIVGQSGTLVEAGEQTVVINGQTVHEFVDFEMKNGIRYYYWESKDFGKIEAESTTFHPNDDTVFNHVLDHIGKVQGGNSKEGIDRYSNGMANVGRDIYLMQIIDIMQLNREIFDHTRMRKSHLTVKMSDLKGSGVPPENADSIIGILDPHSFGKSKYEGFDVAEMASRGASRFKALICPKNTWGIGDFFLPLFFMGECGWTFEMEDNPDVDKVAKGLYRP